MVKTEVNTFTPILKIEKSEFKNEIDEITHTIVEGINKERIGTKYNSITAKGVAMKFNMHPATRKDITQRRYILEKCKDWGYGKAFYYFTRLEKANENINKI